MIMTLKFDIVKSNIIQTRQILKIIETSNINRIIMKTGDKNHEFRKVMYFMLCVWHMPLQFCNKGIMQQHKCFYKSIYQH